LVVGCISLFRFISLYLHFCIRVSKNDGFRRNMPVSQKNKIQLSHPTSVYLVFYILIKLYNSWTDHVRNEKVLLRVKEQRNILHEIRKRKANWIGHILRRNCLLKQVIEGKIKGEMEVARRRGRRRKKLLDDLKDRRGYSRLKEEALDRTMWRHRFGGGFGPVVRQNTEWMMNVQRSMKYIIMTHSSSTDVHREVLRLVV